MKYCCKQCGFQTTLQDRLKQHVDSVHERIRNKCPDCDYETPRKEDLKMHILVHHEAVRFAGIESSDTYLNLFSILYLFEATAIKYSTIV